MITDLIITVWTLARLLAGLLALTIAVRAAIAVLGARPVLERLRDACRALWRALDILGAAIWQAPLYVIKRADRPSGRQMVSSYVGKAAANGHRWARWAADVIDLAVWLWSGEADHCRMAWLEYRGLDG